jgi:c(7)-type cytochrome triheme protein
MKTEKNDNGQRTTDNAERTSVHTLQSVVRGLWSVVNALRSPVCNLQSFLPVLASLILTVFLFSVAFAVDGDIVFKRQGGEGGVPTSTFPHWFHRIRYKCYACHPTLFEMKAGANKITMDAIQEGKFCGTCHNGKVAWAASFETCNRCHVEK